MDRKSYQQSYWQSYKAAKKRITLMVSASDYAALQRRATAADSTRTAGQQLWIEAQAYREDRYLPPAEVTARIDQLYIELHRLYDLVSQLQRSFVTKPSILPDVLTGLHRVKQAVDQFLSLRKG